MSNNKSRDYYQVKACFPKDFSLDKLRDELLQTAITILKRNRSVTRTLNGIKVALYQYGLGNEWLTLRQFYLIELTKVKAKEGLKCFLLRASEWELATLRATIETLGITVEPAWKSQMDKQKQNNPDFYHKE